MELRRLRYFLRIAAEGSIGRTSRVLGIAQPALSRQMQLLEAELGVQLFQRVTKGMQLTEEGEFLREALGHPIDQIEGALRNVRSFATRTEAVCNFGMPNTVAEVIGPRLIRRFARDMPNLRLRLIEDLTPNLQARMQRGTLDVAIIPGMAPDERLFHSPVVAEPMMLVGPGRSMREWDRGIPVAELANYPLIVNSSPLTSPSALEKAAISSMIKLEIVHEIDSLEVIKSLVRDGIGYAILPPLAFHHEQRTGSLKGVPITGSDELIHLTHFVTQVHWRISLSVFAKFRELLFDEWKQVVDSGDWPGEWVFPRQGIDQFEALMS